MSDPGSGNNTFVAPKPGKSYGSDYGTLASCMNHIYCTVDMCNF